MIERAYAKLEGELGRPATDEEMCAELDVTQDEFYSLLNKAKSVSLLNIDDSAVFNRGDKKLLMGLFRAQAFVKPIRSSQL
jgi:RNA polymerase sigma factor for flagellar operon FliA